MATNAKKKNIANNTIRKRKSSGPFTESGKNISSKNALIHGATSPKLLNEAEKERYATLLADLKESYPSPNPLIRLQLERIAKINIQLERILI
jgi:hypothetical protein